MEKSAAIALFIHRDLATFNDSACDQYAGMLKEASEESLLAVKRFAFSPDEKIDDDRLQDIIEAIDNQTTHSLGVYILNALFENAQVSSKCPFWAALRLLSLPENKGDNALSANMASLYDPSDLMDCEFDPIAIDLYLRLSRNSPSSEYLNWLREGMLALYYDYWIEVLTNLASNEPLELLNLLFDKGALPEHFEDAFSDWDADIDTIGTDRRLDELLPKLSCRAFSSITESLLEHFNDPLTWKDRLITYGNVLIKRNWLASLAPDKQITVANAILDSCLAKQSEWLLRAVNTPQLDHDVVASILLKAEKMLTRKAIEKKPTFKSNVGQMVKNLKAKNGAQLSIE